MNGVKVILYKEKDDGSRTFGFADETITSDGADGKPGDYSFEELDPGRYQVCFELPNGYAFTVSGASGAGGTASDSDAGLGTPPAAAGSQVACSDVFELQAGEENLTLDAGLVKGRIGDYVWFDRNGDGTEDEQAKDGFNGVKVELFKKNAQDEFVKIDETVTADKDGDPDRPGYYLFDELDPGEYIVCFEPPSGYVFTQLLRGAIGRWTLTPIVPPGAATTLSSKRVGKMLRSTRV